MRVLALARDIRRDGARLQALAAPRKALIHDASREAPAAHDEALGHAVNEDIALIDAEVQEGFTAIIVAHEEHRQFAARGKGEPRLHTVIEGRGGFDGFITAVPIVGVMWPGLARLREF